MKRSLNIILFFDIVLKNSSEYVIIKIYEFKGGVNLELTKYHYCIWLTKIFGIANPKIHKVIEKYGSPENAYNEITRGDRSVLSNDETKQLNKFSMGSIDKIISHCEKKNISLCALGDSNYPKLLKEIYDPPVIFYYRGDLSCLDALSLTFVGARDVTPYIRRLCSRISYDIARMGITLVSGMAHGVDACVHTACVGGEGKTVAVLACGIDEDYPTGSLKLRREIVELGGVCMTELPPGTGASSEYFNPRNRIMAGLTRGTAVFQASMTSGALVTASYALDENRDVFCVPPPDLLSSSYSGVVGFLRDGAVPIFNHDDILNEYRGLYI